MTPTAVPQSDARKREDVGYGRPPVEHQFKPGQKRPPRKAKRKKEPAKSPLTALWKVLQEQRRIIVNGKPVWMSNAELILRKGFEFAEKDDSPTISSLIADLMLVGENPEDLEKPNRTIFDREATPGSITYFVTEGPDSDDSLPFQYERSS